MSKHRKNDYRKRKFPKNENYPKKHKITENIYSRNLKKRILKLPKYNIPENRILSNFQIPENNKLSDFQIPENRTLMNYKIPKK